MERKTMQKIAGRITGFLFCLAMAFVFLPTASVKADDVASIGTTKYATLQEAFSAATESCTIKMLSDVTVAEGETLALNEQVQSATLDLNGHSLSINGTLGGVESDGNLIPGLGIQSTVPGVFNSNGTINVSLQPWTGDTYNFTGGTINKYLGVDGGTVNISGGEFKSGLMFNNGGDADVIVKISGTPKFSQISDETFVAYGPADALGDGRPRHDIHMSLNGGYFSVDPRALYKVGNWEYDEETGVGTLKSVSDEYKYCLASKVVQGYTYYLRAIDVENNVSYTEINPANITNEQLDDYKIYCDYKPFITIDESKIEQYSNQSDWTADSTIYKWRIVDPNYSADVAVTGVTLNKTTLSLEKGKSETLTATVAPADATDKTVTWTSDKPAVATVKDGKVTAVAAGKATITAKAGEKTAVCEVTVTEASSDIKTDPDPAKDPSKDTTTGTGDAQKPGTEDTAKKAANSLSVKAKNVTLKVKTVKKKNQKITAKKAYTISGAVGKVSYKLVGVKKAKFKKNFSVNAKNGAITVKKGLKKGTYKVTVAVTAAGDDKTEEATRNVTVVVKVK